MYTFFLFSEAACWYVPVTDSIILPTTHWTQRVAIIISVKQINSSWDPFPLWSILTHIVEACMRAFIRKEDKKKKCTSVFWRGQKGGKELDGKVKLNSVLDKALWLWHCGCVWLITVGKVGRSGQARSRCSFEHRNRLRQEKKKKNE